MPADDDMKHHSAEVKKGRSIGDTPVASVLLDEHTAGADEKSTDEASAAPHSLDHSMPQEFTFFQKKKRTDQTVLTRPVAHVTNAQLQAFAAKLDFAVAVNAKTHRHIAELMALMSEVALTVTANEPTPKHKRSRQSKYLFYACLVGFGVALLLFSPSGHNIITQLLVFLAR